MHAALLVGRFEAVDGVRDGGGGLYPIVGAHSSKYSRDTIGVGVLMLAHACHRSESRGGHRSCVATPEAIFHDFVGHPG